MTRLARPVIQRIEEGTPAAEAGLRPGDTLLKINGRPVRDDLDFRFLCADELLLLTIMDQTGQKRRVMVDKEYDEDLGLDFGGMATYDGIYTCLNNCLFCYVRQQPAGLRPTLAVKDDDFRLSYMHGNFITLTGIREEHWERIFEQRLSPLYISVHATGDQLRAHLLGTQKATGIMERLKALADGGIQFHTQVVAVPGLNDGPALDRTIADLISLGPDALLSISVVPVGLTRHREGLAPLRPYTAAEASDLIDLVESWQERLWPVWGSPVVFPGDEWYIVAGRAVPEAERYGDYGQLENGVGLVRSFLDQMAETTARLPKALPARRRVTVATGVLGRETLEQAADWLMANIDGLSVDVQTVPNRFYGSTITVAGLLLGQDMVDHLREQELGEMVILPAVAFRESQGRSLDNLLPAQISQELGGLPVALAESPAELATFATGGLLAPRLPRRRRLRRHLAVRH